MPRVRLVRGRFELRGASASAFSSVMDEFRGLVNSALAGWKPKRVALGLALVLLAIAVMLWVPRAIRGPATGASLQVAETGVELALTPLIGFVMLALAVVLIPLAVLSRVAAHRATGPRAVSAEERELPAGEILALLQSATLSSADLVLENGGWRMLVDSEQFNAAGEVARDGERRRDRLRFALLMLAGFGLVAALVLGLVRGVPALDRWIFTVHD